MRMKSILLLLCFCLIHLSHSAQADKSGAIPITKEEALKFKTFNQALNLPPEYEVLGCSITFICKDGIYRVSTELVNLSATISLRKTGDKMAFSDITVKKGDRRIHLEGKTYIFK
jgi:catabolite regulation protein CreA